MPLVRRSQLAARALRLALLILLSTPGAVLAQASFSAEGGTVVINCPDEIELQVLLDYVGTT